MIKEIKKFEKGFKSTNSEGEKLEIKYKYSTNYYLSELDENKFIVDIEGLEFNFSTSQIINFINN